MGMVDGKRWNRFVIGRLPNGRGLCVPEAVQGWVCGGWGNGIAGIMLAGGSEP